MVVGSDQQANPLFASVEPVLKMEPAGRFGGTVVVPEAAKFVSAERPCLARKARRAGSSQSRCDRSRAAADVFVE